MCIRPGSPTARQSSVSASHRHQRHFLLLEDFDVVLIDDFVDPFAVTKRYRLVGFADQKPSDGQSINSQDRVGFEVVADSGTWIRMDTYMASLESLLPISSDPGQLLSLAMYPVALVACSRRLENLQSFICISFALDEFCQR